VPPLHGEPSDDPFGGGALELGRALYRHTADTRVLKREPPQNRRHASGLLCFLEPRVAKPRRVEQELEERPLGTVARDGQCEHAEELGSVGIDRGVREPPGVVEPEAPSSLAKVPLDDGEPTTERLGRPDGEPTPRSLERLDAQPALVRPLARRDAVPRAERGIEVAGVLDAEVAQPRSDARLVDDPVPAMSLGELDVGLERGLDDVRVRVCPGHADEHADVAALDEPEAAGTAGDLRELPRQQGTPLDPVELRRLGEEEGLARQVDAVAEHVGRYTDLGGAREEA